MSTWMGRGVEGKKVGVHDRWKKVSKHELWHGSDGPRLG